MEMNDIQETDDTQGKSVEYNGRQPGQGLNNNMPNNMCCDLPSTDQKITKKVKV